MDRQQFCGKEGVVAVVEHDRRVVGQLTAQAREEPRWVDPTLRIVTQPLVEVRRLLLSDRRLDARAARRRFGNRSAVEQPPGALQHQLRVAFERDARG
jgi:hypothetical protein